jgi:hypothetical protein
MTKTRLCAAFAATILGLALLAPSNDALAGDRHWKARGHDKHAGYHDWRGHPGRGYGPPTIVYAGPRVIYPQPPIYITQPPVVYVPERPSIRIVVPIDLR